MTLRKTWKKGDLNWWNWHREHPREKQKIDIHGEKGVAALSLMDRGNERKRRSAESLLTNAESSHTSGNFILELT